ncbi:aminotransferase class III-fold pyridoxal phosphate-dependent enzyme, partial [Elizabethkingia meningoseptica]|uniref:aminotransferase class III-fold pyridoxal phosphate-dependent enzyme n=2 Tax=Weeksellaceae TaxID=2762318 RepID=UPI001627DBA6
ALDVVADEKLSERAEELGQLFRSEVEKLMAKTDLITRVRGKGLLNAILINDTPESSTAWNLCLQLKENGLLAKPTHGNIIRLAPPLVITEEQLLDCIKIIEKTFLEYKN